MNFFKETYKKLNKNEFAEDIDRNESSKKSEGKQLQEIIQNYVAENKLKDTPLGKTLLDLKLKNNIDETYIILRQKLFDETCNGRAKGERIKDERLFHLLEKIIYTTKNTGILFAALQSVGSLEYKDKKLWDEAAELVENIGTDLLSPESGSLDDKRFSTHFKIGTVKDFSVVSFSDSPLDKNAFIHNIAFRITEIANPKSIDFLIKQTTNLLGAFLKASKEQIDITYAGFANFFMLMRGCIRALGVLKYTDINDIVKAEEFIVKIEEPLRLLAENSQINNWKEIIRHIDETKEELGKLKRQLVDSNNKEEKED